MANIFICTNFLHIYILYVHISVYMYTFLICTHFLHIFYICAHFSLYGNIFYMHTFSTHILYVYISVVMYTFLICTHSVYMYTFLYGHIFYTYSRCAHFSLIQIHSSIYFVRSVVSSVSVIITSAVGMATRLCCVLSHHANPQNTPPPLICNLTLPLVTIH